jgi:tryptophan 2,3-dioxygenase
MAQKEVYYSDYLQLDKILNAQSPESDKKGIEAHDEMLFIITHQAYELWFKQILYELDSILELFSSPRVDDNDPTLQIVVHRANRINTILTVLIDQINIMETMSSLDFLDFRDLLRPASGFQSIQWKELEAKLGLSYGDRHGKGYYTSQLRPEDVDKVKKNEAEGNLLDGLNSWLERMPFFDDKEAWESSGEMDDSHPFWQQYRQAYSASLLEIESANLELFDEVLFGKGREGKRRLSPRAARAALFILLYRGYPILHLPYQLLISLLTTDELMATWRGRHMNMVFRMIGTRVGTGNSSGKGYLKAAMDKHYIFKELAELNGLLIDRRSLPKLPKSLESMLGFARQ